MQEKLKIISTDLLNTYLLQSKSGMEALFEGLQDAEISTDTFSFYTSVSSVFSSKIEGEEIDLDSYVKHKRFGIDFLPDYTKKIDDLYDAYTFAQNHILNEDNIAEAHRLLSKHIVASHQQGKIRTQNMYVSTPDGKIEYVAASPYEVTAEMQKLYADIAVLLHAPLKLTEVFFYAAFIHLVFVKIHPFNDGNGRTGRLLEKWFLAQKLGANAWFVQSEKNYYQQHQTYYNNLRALGLEYPELDYGKALPFLLMLPEALNGGHTTGS
jgi:Fic family protein